MKATPAATFTYYGLTFALDVEELQRAIDESSENPGEGSWIVYTHELGQGFGMELWSTDGGESWRSEISNEALEVGVVAHGETMTGAVDALMDMLRPLGWALDRLKAGVTNWGP